MRRLIGLASGNRIGLSAGVLRGVAMLLRFPATVWLAAKLPIETFALFVLAQTFVILFTFLSGLELHQTAIRRWVRLEGEEAAEVERRHGRLGIGVALPVLLALLVAGLLLDSARWPELLLLGSIALIEYRQTEAGRYLIAAGRNTAAMWLTLVRQASWLPIACGLVQLWPGHGLLLILCSWLAASLASELLALRFRRPAGASPLEPGLWSPGWWRALAADGRLAAPFYLIVIAVMAREQADRFILSWKAGPEQVAVYGFFATLAGLSLAIIQTMLIAENSRAILAGAAEGPDAVRRLARGNLLLSVAISAGVAIVAWFASGPLLVLLGREVFVDSREVLAVLLLGTLAQAVNNSQTLALTALHRERGLAVVEVGSAMLSVGLNIWLVPYHGALAAAGVIGGTSALAALVKLVLIRRG